MRTPGYFALALVTLSLGIGATTVLFSITESVLWRPFSFAGSERLVELTEFNTKANPLGNPVSADNFLVWREKARSFERLAAMAYGESHSLTGAGERVRSNAVSAGFFETLRVSPALGRTFDDAEERSLESRPLILSDAFRQRRFGAAPDVLGRQVKLDGESYTVVGVLPPVFRLEFVPGASEPDLFLPLHPADPKRKRNQRALLVIGRLKDGVTGAQAGLEMNALARQLSAGHPEDAHWTARVENLRVASTKFEQRTLYLFLGFACLVLLVACANVAGLQLVRFTGRRKEYALRMALGAPRGALLRQALAENAWIAIPGGAAGALLASWGVAGVRAVLPAGKLARSENLAMDGSALAFVLALSLAATLLFALAPAMGQRKLDLDRSLRAGPKGGTASRGIRCRLDMLMGAEVALAFVLLFSAGLFVSSYARLREAPLGFDPHRVLTLRIAPGGGLQSTPEERRLFFGRLLEKARSAGGIRGAALVNGLPLDFPAGVQLERAGGSLHSLARVITPEYFRVMGIPLLRGRAFGDADSPDASRVAIVNENLARALFGGENPVGRRLTLLSDGDPSIPAGGVEIVGLARNTKELGLDEVPFEDVYLPFAQNPMRSMYVVMKTNGAVEALAAALRGELRSMDADAVLYDVASMDERLRSDLRGARFNLSLVTVFASLAVLLAAVGMYGAVAFSTAQRTREFAVRLALGARTRSIVGLTLGHTARLTLAGAATGLGTALVLGSVLKSALYLAPHLHTGLIYGVAVNDPALLAGAAGALVSVATVACVTPAIRASSVQPAEALRHE
ncbi:MAG: ABC transporter permease [Candidatus Sulfopaludibacter sp.]|nr:ABC transporter permease [Candidatus Sulfopaludibacter sp.]